MNPQVDVKGVVNNALATASKNSSKLTSVKIKMKFDKPGSGSKTKSQSKPRTTSRGALGLNGFVRKTVGRNW